MLRLDDSFRESLEQMTTSYEVSLHEAGWEAASYLKTRGIDKETALSFRLGVVNDKFPEHQPYEGMISVPYRTLLGGVVSLKFRRPHACGDDCQHGKYISPYGARLYNTIALEEADKLGYVCVTEGEFDAIILGSNGFPAVGIPGVDSWRAHPEWAGVLAGYPRIYVFPDSDEPGERLGKAIQSAFGGAVRFVRPDGCKDVGDWYCRAGREEFMGRISERIRG